MNDFLAENRVTVAGSFAAVHITPASTNDGDNGDAWRVTINTGDNGGQDMAFAGRDVAFVSFTVYGWQELQSVVDGLAKALEMLPQGPAVYALTE